MRVPDNTTTDQAVTLTTHHTAYRIISHNLRGETVYSTHPLHAADVAASWYDFLANCAATEQMDVVAKTTERTEKIITVDDLPAAGTPTPQPLLPRDADRDADMAVRFYHFSSGPYVLRTSDAVRTWLEKTTEEQRRPGPHTVPVDLDTLLLFETTVIERTRSLTYADLTALA